MRKYTLWLAVALLGLAMACGDDEPAPEPISITAEDFITSIAENPDAGQVLGSITASTNRGTLNFALSNQSTSGALALSNTGELSVADRGSFDFEVNQTITAVVTLTNEDVSEQVSVTINITDVDEEEITFDETADFDVVENAVEGIQVGTVVATSSTGGTITYSIVSLEPADLGSGVFSIDANSGLITVGANAREQLDFEAFESVTVTVEATSSNGATLQRAITINVLNLPEIRFDAALIRRTITENQLVQGDELISWEITSDRAIESYELTDLETSETIDAFTIDGPNNRLLVDDPAALDFEIVQSYKMRIQANGEGGGVATATLEVIIGDDPNDNSVLETADIYYNLDSDAMNLNGDDFDGTFFGNVSAIEGVFMQSDRNGENLAMGFTSSRVGLQPSGWTSDVHGGTFTVAMWVKLSRAGSGSRVVYEFNCGQNEAFGVFFETITGRLWLRQSNSTGQASRFDIGSTLYTSVNDNDTDWVFLAISVDANQIITYTKALETTQFNSSAVLTGDDVLYQGNSTTSTSFNISGERCNNAAAAQFTVDDVVIFNRALSNGEIDKLYNELNEQ